MTSIVSMILVVIMMTIVLNMFHHEEYDDIMMMSYDHDWVMIIIAQRVGVWRVRSFETWEVQGFRVGGGCG